MKKFSDFAKEVTIMNGEKIKIEEVLEREIVVNGYRINDSKYGDGKKVLTLQINFNGENRIIFTGSSVLFEQVESYKEEIPFIATIQKINNKFYTFS